MSTDPEDLFWTELKGVIKTAWPEMVDGVTTVAGSIRRSSQLNRENWETLINSEKLEPPYVVIGLGDAPQEDMAADSMNFRQSVDVYYVTLAKDVNAWIDAADHSKGKDIQAYLRRKGRDLRTGLVHYDNTGFALSGRHPVVDASESNPANEVFYQLEANMQAVRVHFDALYGDPLGVD